MSPSSSALGVSAATESTTIRSTEPERTSASTISSACSPVSGWLISSSCRVDAQLLRVLGVQRVFGVDEGAHAAELLHLGDDLQRQRGLARRFRAVDLDHPAARQAAHAQRDVQPQRAGGHDLDVLATSPSPRRMIEPLPNCFSICASAACSALAFSVLSAFTGASISVAPSLRRDYRRKLDVCTVMPGSCSVHRSRAAAA
jgi:hypothetical protein